MTKDVLLRVVKATRMSLRLAEDTKKLLFDQNEWTIADEISGFLCDALFEYCGEQLAVGQDFTHDSATYRLLIGEYSDGEVTDLLMRMAKEHEPVQPKPNLVGRDEFLAMVQRGCGYAAEGEPK